MPEEPRPLEDEPDAGDHRDSPAPPGRPGRRAVGCGVLAASAAAFVLYQAVTWPDVGRLTRDNPATTAFLERARSRAGDDGAVPPIRWVAYSRLSPHLKRAVLVSEDIGFFSHGGFATDELEVALGELLRGERLRGASTITQQVAKNLWLSPSRNPWRKVKEALLTLQLEHRLGKRRILEIYLNVAQFGPTEFGAENAAQQFFGRSASALSESEAAALAAALPSPGRWYPGSGSRAAANRKRIVLGRMREAEWLWKVI